MTYEFEIKDLTLAYPWAEKNVFENFNLNIVAGEFYILLGQNGTGKSSLIKCLAGVQNWKSGDILRKGISRKIDTKDFNYDLVYVSEDIQMPQFRIFELIKIYEQVWKRFDLELFRKLINISKISESSEINSLSRGQTALVQIALALAIKPKVLLIDEITAVLDPYVRQILISELASYRESRGATIIIASNIATEFNGVNARAILVDHKGLFMEGHVREMVKKFSKIQVAKENLKMISLDFVEVGRSEDGTRVFVSQNAKLEAQHLLVNNEVTLEEIFIFLTGRNR